MPELPDLTVYLDSFQARIVGQTLERIRVVSPFLLRTVEPSLEEAEGKTVIGVRRIGKQIIFCLERDLYLIIHLMIAGRFRWQGAGARAPTKVPAKIGLAAFDFSAGTLLLTEASTKKRASLRLARGEEGLRALDPGGIEVLEADLERFRSALASENHTLKRALTDPRLFSGIGNAYSDEILHRSRLSPLKQTRQLTDEEVERLHGAAKETLLEWIERLRRQAGDSFPEHVTAFREEMAVHGKYRKPCPVCGSPVQRIVYAENQTNYCARCQTGGRLLADRALSRLLKRDWPRTIEETEG